LQCVGTEVPGVVVGKGHAAHAHFRESLGCHRRRTEEEPLLQVTDALAAIRDTALEVEDEQVGAPRDLLEASGQQAMVGPREVRSDARPSIVSPANATVTDMSPLGVFPLDEEREQLPFPPGTRGTMTRRPEDAATTPPPTSASRTR
jgi:hypothetical protein